MREDDRQPFQRRARSIPVTTAAAVRGSPRVLLKDFCVHTETETMSYSTFVASLARANSRNLRNFAVPPARCRSTVASPKRQEEKERMEECPVVEAQPVELISQTKNVPNAQAKSIHIDFDNTQEAYKSKKNIELLRSLLVFKLCTFDVLVERNKEVSLEVIQT